MERVTEYGMPFEMVEGEEFKAVSKVLDPGFEVPSCMTIYRDVLSLYLSEKQKLKDYFTASRQRVCLTIDSWISIQKLNYMCITAHYTDQNWKLHKKILNFCQVGSHEGVNIGKTLEKCLLEWGIDKVFTVTLDNTSANDIALKYLMDSVNSWNTAIMKAEFMQVRCAAHALRLLVKDGLKVYHQSITRIRAVVRYVLSSPSRLGKFKQCVEKEKIACKKGLVLDDKTNWNSTLLMLEAAEKFEKAFARLEREDSEFYTKFCSSTSTSTVDREASAHGKKTSSSGKDMSPLRAPCAEDWSCARNFVEFLDVVLDGTVKFSAPTYVTSDSFLSNLCDIHDLGMEFNGEDPFLNNKANKMFNKYIKYWGKYEDMHPFLFIAVLLDPREKEVGLKFYLGELCEKDEDLLVKIMCKVKSNLGKLYEEYKLLYSGPEIVGCDTERQAYRKRRRKIKEERFNVEYKSEVDRYLEEPCERTRANSQFDLLGWWKTRSPWYSIMSCIARDILAIPMSSIASESALFTEKRILDPYRSSLSPRTVEALICTQNWLHSTTYLDLSSLVDDVDDIETDILGPVTNLTYEDEKNYKGDLEERIN